MFFLCWNLSLFGELPNHQSAQFFKNCQNQQLTTVICVWCSDRSEIDIEKKVKYTRTKGELGLNDLPPIEDLKITVDENKCKPIGSVLNIVDTMGLLETFYHSFLSWQLVFFEMLLYSVSHISVVIQSLPNTPPLDIDTVLFVDRGQCAIGKIFDVFGPVHEPLYCVRFNSHDHVKEKNIAREQVVYCAPNTEFTSYIHTAELLKYVNISFSIWKITSNFLFLVFGLGFFTVLTFQDQRKWCVVDWQ